ncbi:MAG: hypothetical protein QW692_03685, partial [Nitrososphaerota archaeon]
RLHTDWAIVNYEVIPPMPLAGERSRLQVSVGIAAIIEPLPQTVEVVLKIDGVQKGVEKMDRKMLENLLDQLKSTRDNGSSN